VEFCLENDSGAVVMESDSSPQKTICIVVATPLTVQFFLREPIRALGSRYRVCVAVNTSLEAMPVLPAGVEVIHVPIEREPSPRRDLRALTGLIRLFRSRRFDAVHSITPKAGLLSTMAGFLARVPVRVHTFTGQVWATRAGSARRLLKAADQVTSLLATHILVDGRHQREFLLQECVVSSAKSRVLADGSISGVDTARFSPSPSTRDRVRRRLGIAQDGILFLFLGRLKVDKGILDLANAFASMSTTRPNAWLLIVGPDEEGLKPEIMKVCASAGDRFRMVDLTDAPEDYMAAADVLCLPSYREGFPSVILEAASTGIPAIASDIYGIRSTMVADRTGLFHNPRDRAGLQSRMELLAKDAGLRETMGLAAHTHAHERFSSDIVSAAWLDFYRSVVG
jgi:glycosyltransferase involved in cell wall biosynthesis